MSCFLEPFPIIEKVYKESRRGYQNKPIRKRTKDTSLNLLFSVIVWCLLNKMCWLDISWFSLWSLVTAHCIEILDKDFSPQVVQKVLPIVCETLKHYRRHMSRLDWTLRKGVRNNGETKGLASITQLVKVRRGKLVLALPSIRFSWNFYQIISGTKYE